MKYSKMHELYLKLSDKILKNKIFNYFIQLLLCWIFIFVCFFYFALSFIPNKNTLYILCLKFISLFGLITLFIITQIIDNKIIKLLNNSVDF